MDVAAQLFTVADAATLSRVPRALIRKWERVDVFRGQQRGEDGSTVFYTFRDLVGLRVLAGMHERGFRAPRLRAVHAVLRRYATNPWAELKLFVAGTAVNVFDKKTGRILDTAPEGQLVSRELAIDLEPVEAGVRRDVKRARTRSREQVGKLERTKGVVANALCIAGTRIPVSVIQSFHEAGFSAKKIQEEYPQLRIADIRAALRATAA